MILFLLGFSAVILDSLAQEINNLKYDTHGDEAVFDYGVEWNRDRQYEPPNVHADTSDGAREHQTEIPDLPVAHPSYWGPVSSAPRPFLYGNENPRDEEIKVFDYSQSNSNTPQHGISDANDTSAFVYQPNPLNGKRGEISPDASRITQPSTTILQSASDPGPAPPGFPMFYSPLVSINMRRRYTNGAPDYSSHSKSNYSVSEPITSSYEETYSHVVPPAPFPGLQLSPNSVLPFSGFGNPTQFYPFPSLFRPSSTRVPNGNDPTFREDKANDGAKYLDKDLVAENAVLGKQNVKPETDSVKSTPVRSKVPQRASNAFVLPTLPTSGKFPPFFQRPVFPVPLVSREQIPSGQQMPLAELSSLAPSDANSFVPQHALSPPFQSYPFLLPPSVLPTAIPRYIQQYPLMPDTPTIEPVDVSAAVADNAEDRHPVETSADGVLPLSPTLPEVVADDSNLADKTSPSVEPDVPSLPYEFGFDMNDGKGTDQHRMEASNGAGVVRGSYGYRDLFGVYRLVNYVADKNGFRAYVKSNEPGVASAGSADVVVEAENPPPHVVEEAVKSIVPELEVVPSDDAALIVE